MTIKNYIYSLVLIPTEKAVFFDNEELFIKVVTALKKTAAACRWHIDEIMHDDDHVYLTIQVPALVSPDDIVEIMYGDKESPFTTQNFWSGDYSMRSARKV